MLNTILGSGLVALGATMLAFAQRRGYLPVSRPTHRVYRQQRPRYFWALIAGYALVGAIGIHILSNG